MPDWLWEILDWIVTKTSSVWSDFSESASKVHKSSANLADAISDSMKINTDWIRTISWVIAVNEKCLNNVWESFRATGDLFNNLSGIWEDVSFLLDRSMLSFDAYSKWLLELLNYMDDINKWYNYLLEWFYIIISWLIFDFYWNFQNGNQLKLLIESFQSKVDFTSQHEITVNFVNKNLRYILSWSCYDSNPDIYLRNIYIFFINILTALYENLDLLDQNKYSNWKIITKKTALESLSRIKSIFVEELSKIDLKVVVN